MSGRPPSRSLFPLLAALGCPLPPPAVDLNAPKVASIAPPDQAVNVPTTATVQACFDAPLRPSSVTAAGVAFGRTDGATTRAVDVTLALDASGTCLGITPAAPLSPSSHYQLTLKNTLLGANGIALGDSKTADVYTASFSTIGAPATAVMLVPADGLPDAPLDLAQVVVAFDAPVTLAGDGGPLSLLSSGLPGGGPSSLSADGRLATSPFVGAAAGTQIQVALSPGVTDPSGQLPETGGPLGFTLGDCSEASAPGVGAGLVVARDVDAWIQFTADRPGLCGASVQDPGSPSAGTLRATAASCESPYDPCNLGQLCICAVPLGPLGPGDAVVATPTLQGYDGQVGLGAAAPFQTAAALPPLVLTEVFPGAKSVAYVEVQNRGPGPIDLTGLQLADCGLSFGCASLKGTPVPLGPPGGVGSATLAPGGYALLVDATFAAGAAPPAGALLLAPIAGTSMIHLSTSGFQSLALFSPQAGAVPVSTYDGSLLPKSGYSFERIDPGASDATPNDWALSTTPGGTPGACNSVTPGSECAP